MGAFAAIELRGWGVLPAIAGGLAVWVAVFLGPLAASAMGGRAAATLYSPSGGSTPRRREYSHAESLAARALYQEAIDAFEMAIGEDPTDPTPYLRVARIYRDRLARYDDAARWFVRARAQSHLPYGLDFACVRELVELYEVKMRQPGRAAPVLARLAEERAGTPEAAWATQELRRIKARWTSSDPLEPE